MSSLPPSLPGPFAQCGNVCRAFLLPAIVSSKDRVFDDESPCSGSIACLGTTISGVNRQAEEELVDLKNALSSANSRLAKMDALEADTKAQAEELKKLREERRERDASLAEEQGRTQHLVRLGGAVFFMVSCFLQETRNSRRTPPRTYTTIKLECRLKTVPRMI